MLSPRNEKDVRTFLLRIRLSMPKRGQSLAARKAKLPEYDEQARYATNEAKISFRINDRRNGTGNCSIAIADLSKPKFT